MSWKKQAKYLATDKGKATRRRWYHAHHRDRRAWAKAYYCRNSSRIKAYKREYRKLNMAKMSEYDRQRYNVKRRFYHMLRRYGVTEQQWNEMIGRQNHQCAICGEVLRIDATVKGNDRPHVDHCHTTGQVRGILCSRCNIAIGAMKDSPHIAICAAYYLCKEGNDAAMANLG